MNGKKLKTNGSRITDPIMKDIISAVSVADGLPKQRYIPLSTTSKAGVGARTSNMSSRTSSPPTSSATGLRVHDQGLSFTLWSPLPTLNEYIQAERTHRHLAAKMKRTTQESLLWEMKNLPKIEKPAIYEFTWVVKDKRTDPDNIAFGKKFILDALQEAGKLKRDSLQWIIDFADHFELGDPHVQLEVTYVD